MDDGTRSDTMQILDMATRLTVQYLQNLAVNNSKMEIHELCLE
jgi:hypothetical protein